MMFVAAVIGFGVLAMARASSNVYTNKSKTLAGSVSETTSVVSVYGKSPI